MGALSLVKKAVALGSKQASDTAEISDALIDLGLENPFNVDLSTYQSNGQVAKIQSIFFDNSDNGYALTVTLTEAGNTRFIIPAGAQAWLPMPFNTNGGRFSIASDYAGVIPIILSSLAVPAAIWQPEGSAGGAARITKTVTIPISQSVSTSVARDGLTLIGFLVPDLTNNAVEIKGSLDNSAFHSLFNSAGQKASYDVSGGAGIYYLDNYSEAEAANYINITGTVTESAARTITLIFEKVL